MNQSLVSGVTGAAPIWNKLMKKVLEGKLDIWPKQPEGIVGAHICNVSGLTPPNAENDGDKGCPTRFEYFMSGTVPKTNNVSNKDVFIFKDTGQVANEEALPEQVEAQNKTFYTDPTGATYCLTCPVSSSSATLKYPLRVN